MKKILLIGGAGYVGTMLAEDLSNNYDISVYDLFIYGDNFKNYKIKKIIGDIRDIKKLKEIIKGHEVIIHLACISNDPSFDLNPYLGKSINYDCFEDCVKIAKDSGIERFIYASSSSVYGVKDFNDVSEEVELKPLTDYSKFKAKCEDILLKYNDNNFTTTILRPATVCGYSYRQRFDLVVNILVNQAINNDKITIYGGEQLRPNINIKDMCQAYKLILDSDKKSITGEIFNVGFENYSVNELAKIVCKNVQKKIKILKEFSNDNRSYHISSAKIMKKLFFKPKYNIDEAIKDLVLSFQKNLFEDSLNNEMYFNIKRMKNLRLS
jgi:nucleoside-diphosphate-sugar epimerase